MAIVTQIGTPATPAFVEVTTQGTVTLENGKVQPVDNVFHFFRTNLVNPVSEPNVWSAFLGGPWNHVDAQLFNTYVHKQGVVRFFDDPTRYAAPQTWSGGGGYSDNDQLPIDVAVCIQLQTQNRGRGVNGSKHMSPIPEDATTMQELQGAFITAWQAIADDFVNSFTDGDGNQWFPMVLYKSRSDLHANPSTIVYGRVVQSTLNLTVGTIRRRRERTVINA